MNRTALLAAAVILVVVAVVAGLFSLSQSQGPQEGVTTPGSLEQQSVDR